MSKLELATIGLQKLKQLQEKYAAKKTNLAFFVDDNNSKTIVNKGTKFFRQQEATNEEGTTTHEDVEMEFDMVGVIFGAPQLGPYGAYDPSMASKSPKKHKNLKSDLIGVSTAFKVAFKTKEYTTLYEAALVNIGYATPLLKPFSLTK